MEYVCLFVWGFSSHSRIFTHIETLPLPVKGCKILTYVRHSWPLSSEGSFACHIYRETWHLFMMTRDTHNLFPS